MPETRLERTRRAYDTADADCDRLLQQFDGLFAHSCDVGTFVVETVIAAARLADAGRALIWTQSVEDID